MPEQARRIPIWTAWALAAAIVLLLLGWWASLNLRRPSGKALFAQYVDEAGRNPLLAELRSGGDSLAGPRDSLAYWYRSQQFDRGLEGVAALKQQEPNNLNWLRHEAFFRLAKGDDPTSLRLFEELARNPDTPPEFESWLTWGAALLYTEAPEEAKKVLQEALRSSEKPLSNKEKANIEKLIRQL